VICGVDEAGRGPVLGPLVVAAVMLQSDEPLRGLGVRDSKALTRKRRDELALRIREVAEVEVVVIEAERIDSYRGQGSLNDLEAEAFASAIERLRPDEAYLDAADVVAERFALTVGSHLSFRPRMVCEHKADSKYPVVSAASIVAKSARDGAMDRLEAEFGVPIGSGYPSDEVTVGFLQKWINEKKDLPPHTRRSWRTAKDMFARSRVIDLTNWTDGP